MINELNRKLNECNYDLAALSPEEYSVFCRIFEVKNSIGKIIRYYEGGLYKVIDVSEHIETAEDIILCQELHGEYKKYSIPAEWFYKTVDIKTSSGNKQIYIMEIL